MSRTPNAEQLLAIEHQGGVLLKAGAGSGKTFVLVEHIVYLTSQWINESSGMTDFEHFIKEKFSKVVMMTFTNKAAGEMKLRLFKRFDELVAEHNHPSWTMAREYLTWLTVTTIDGFCRKLIVSGCFPHLSTTADIIFEEQRTSQVEGILEKWFAQKIEQSPLIWDQLIRSKDEIRNSFCRVFNDPSKRIKWRFFSEEEFSDEKIDELIATYYELNNIGAAIAIIENYPVPADANKYEKDLIERLQKMGLPEIKNQKVLSLYEMECAQRSPSLLAKIKTPELEEVQEAYNQLKKWVKSLSEIVSSFNESRDEVILPWFRALYAIYQYIDQNLHPNDGFTFGDIEYYVSLGLDDDDVRERINKEYSYFIVDEFQDTSFLQFDIIKKLISNNLNKLFCVGDGKQAIYGFRGGELAVFNNCSLMIPRNLNLSHNYRSLAEIIEVNNSIFDFVLPIGFNSSPVDPFTVKFEPQTLPPIDYKSQGEIIINDLDLSLGELEKITNDQLDAVEAKMIADQVERLRTEYPTKQNTILYKKLEPSTGLIRHLMNKGIGFTAQFKIELLDDPVLGIFYTLLKRKFDRNVLTRDEFTLLQINNYLQVLGVDENCHQDLLAAFEYNCHYYGPLEAYKKFLFSLNVTNENADLNLSYIDLLCLLYEQNLSLIFSRFKQTSSSKLSMDLRWGAEADKVMIMSTHASKGLEFDHVIIGGVFTNSASIANKNLVGDRPQSFYWYKNFEEKEKVVTPFYHLDREVEKYKNFSESKRLLYVACTRAVEKLIWCTVDVGELQSKIKENSWSSLLSQWQVKSDFTKLTIHKVDSSPYQTIVSETTLEGLPLFYYDAVGIHQKNKQSSELLIAPELSVTRLNSLIDCSRKFYLENVLKLNPSQSSGAVFTNREEDELSLSMHSSAQRGTDIHAALSQAIQRNFIIPRQYLGKRDEATLVRALAKLRPLAQDFTLISEVPIKFPFFGHIISGTPDLILKPKSEDDYQVWDFKTGQISEAKLGPYWLQLKVYAYALYMLKEVKTTASIGLVLYFVDADKTLSLEVNFECLASELFSFWSKQTQPWQRNLEHCGQCVYGDICLK